jgi:single-stranded-DNA-specific exonuclease
MSASAADMSRPKPRPWRVRPVVRAEAEKLAAELGVSVPLASLLLGRELARDAREGQRFLRPDVQSLPSPFRLQDMDRAVDLARRALAERWPILVHGDRDVDGVAATSLLLRLLRELGAEAEPYVPGEVYGVVPETIEAAARRGVRLLILADCGTTAHEPIRRARELGLEVLVLDHHQPEGKLPPASALVNPNRPDCAYEPKLLAGSGVSFKFAWALYLSMEPDFDEDLIVVDLETSGLEADSCEILEVAAVRFRRGLERDVFHSLVRPTRSVPPEAVAIHGLDEAALAEARPLAAVLPELLHFLGSRKVVAHNAEFDAAFLDRACRRLLGTGFPNRTDCTRNRARALFPELPSHSLASLCRHFEIDCERFHRALQDARATGELYYRLLRHQARPRRTEFYQRYLADLTLGTLADVVPMLGENRVLCHFGLRQLARDPRPGLRALCQRAAPNAERLSSRQVSFGMAPLLNAAGRAGKAHLALRLLCTDSPTEARQILEELERLRESARGRVQAMTGQIRDLLERQADLERDRVLVAVTAEHEHGVTGVVANRLMDEFGRAVVLLIDDGLEVRGSARAPEGVDLLELLRRVGGEVERFGGHRQAAGLSVPRDRVEAFRKALNAAAEELYADRPLASALPVDLDLSLEQISAALVQELSLLEPFGAGNPPPVFRLQAVVPQEVRKIGKEERHLRLALGPALHALGWGFADRDPGGGVLDLVFLLETNEYQGQRQLRLNLLDLRPALPPKE